MRRLVDAQSGVFEALGCVVEYAEPDLSDADEIFNTLRGMVFRSVYGRRLRHASRQLKNTVLWNIEAGKHSRAELATCRTKTTALY